MSDCISAESGGSVPSVSVCMPCSRDREWLRTAIRSVLDQSFQDFEIVLTDDTGGALRGMIESFRDARIRHLPNPNRLGMAGNHCRAIGEARGKYVAFLHDDDAWEKDFLKKTCAVLDETPEVGLVLAGANEIDANDKFLCRRPTVLEGGLQADPLPQFLARDFMMMLPSLSLFRKTALERNPRPWLNVITAEVTMYIDLLNAGWKLYYLDEPLVRYRVHKNQIGANDLAHRHGLVTIWRSYHFADERLEDLRKKRLSSALLARAAALVRRRRLRKARNDLIQACRAWPNIVRGKWAAIFWVTFFPVAIPFAEKIWGQLHDPFVHRHEG